MLLKLKNISLYFLLLFLCNGCFRKASTGAYFSQEKRLVDSLFIENFKILDSASREIRNDTIIHCCTGQIAFMETNTKISSSSPGGFVGKMYFLTRDLRAWHEWYEEQMKIKKNR